MMWRTVSSAAADDGTKKLLLEARDGVCVETVLVPMRRHTTICLSSQAGCARGCEFCETARGGLIRNLSSREIIDQALLARTQSDRPVRNLVFMGMGEPTDNLTEVLSAIDMLMDPSVTEQQPFAPGRFTLSTVGNAAGIDELRALRQKGRYRHLKLAVSLNAANDTLRDRLMPINRSYPLKRLRESLLRFPLYRTRDVIVIGYVVLPGINDGERDAASLAEFLIDIPSVVNLIPHAPRAGTELPESSAGQLDRFRDVLTTHGLSVRYRNSRGASLAAGCGQLGTR